MNKVKNYILYVSFIYVFNTSFSDVAPTPNCYSGVPLPTEPSDSTFFNKTPLIKIRPYIDVSIAAEKSNMQNCIQLKGLEKIYFQRAEREESIRNNLINVISLLPVTLAKTEFSDVRRILGQDEYQVTVSDYKIPIKDSELWLREVIDHSHPRISKLWWVVYDNGRRGDIWYYTAYPERNDNKLLPNYKINSVFVDAEDLVTIQVDGSMFRPGGFWTIKGISLTFSPESANITLTRVINVFSILHGYNDDDALEVRSEQVVKDLIEHRDYTAATEDILNGCGLGDLFGEEGTEYSWEDLKQGAFCITNRPGAKISYREFDEPSFIERGWDSEKK